MTTTFLAMLLWIYAWLLLPHQILGTEQTQQERECSADGTCSSSSFWQPPQNPFEYLFGSNNKETEGEATAATAEETDPFESIEEEHVTAEPDFFETIWKLINPEVRRRPETDDAADHHGGEDPVLQKILLASTDYNIPATQSFPQVIQALRTAFDEFQEQLKRTFANKIMGWDRFDPIQIWYSMLAEEAAKNAVWKRKQHRFLPTVNEKQAMSLSDGLYLAQLAYTGRCDTVQDFLQSFQNRSWALLNCTTSTQPSQPAHFVIVRKQPSPASATKTAMSRLLLPPWQQPEPAESVLEVALVIRGTKEMGDALSDALFESSPYRGGYAHDGILQSARWLHRLYWDFFQSLLKASQRSKLKLWLVGHSLGAGTAALASIEFNNHHQLGGDKESDNQPSSSASNNIEAHSLGFGTPAVLSQNLSQSVLPYITTVINDADLVPRMSIATLANAWLASITYNHTEDALEDAMQILTMLRENLPMGDTILTQPVQSSILEWIQSSIENNLQPIPGLALPMEQQLIPPGECIHIFRDGMAHQGNFVPCHRFNEMERVRHMISDHLVDTGYYIGLLSLIRSLKNDPNWRFSHDLMEIPVS